MTRIDAEHRRRRHEDDPYECGRSRHRRRRRLGLGDRRGHAATSAGSTRRRTWSPRRRPSARARPASPTAAARSGSRTARRHGLTSRRDHARQQRRRSGARRALVGRLQRGRGLGELGVRLPHRAHRPAARAVVRLDADRQPARGPRGRRRRRLDRGRRPRAKATAVDDSSSLDEASTRSTPAAAPDALSARLRRADVLPPRRRRRRDPDRARPRGGAPAADRRRHELHLPAPTRHPLLRRTPAPRGRLPARARAHPPLGDGPAAAASSLSLAGRRRLHPRISGCDLSRSVIVEGPTPLTFRLPAPDPSFL